VIRLKTDNEYLEEIARNVGADVPEEHRSNNYYLKRIEENTRGGGGGGGEITVDSAMSTTSKNPVQNKVISAALEGKADNGDIPTSTSDLSDGSDLIKKSNTRGLIKNDGTIDESNYLTQHQDISGKANSADLANVAFSGDYDDLTDKPSLFSGNYNDLSNKPSIPSSTSDLSDGSDIIKKSSTPGLMKNDGTIDTTQYLTQHQSLDSKTVTVEKQQTAESGYTATYVVKQGGVQVEGAKINIPKDFLVKSASVKTCTADDDPVTGYKVGDLYIEFVINVHEGSDDNEYLYLNVNDFVDIYEGDNSTIVVSNNVISVKANVFADKSHTHTKSQITDFPTLATVATSGSYADLSNKPTIPSDVSDLTDTNNTQFTPKSHTHTKSEITNFPTLANVATSGSYNDLSNKPSIPADVSDLTDNNNTAFTPKSHTHTKSEITDFPTLATVATSGSYNDLSNKPSLFSGSYDDLTNKPTLFSGSYNDLTNKPTIPTVVDTVADGNSNAVTSNAVYDYIASVIGDANTWLTS